MDMKDRIALLGLAVEMTKQSLPSKEFGNVNLIARMNKGNENDLISGLTEHFFAKLLALAEPSVK